MADSSFQTSAELSIVVPRRELRSARQEVEDALAEVPVGMSAGGGAGGGSGVSEAREQRRRRREFRWARQRTDDTESQLEVLENIEGELTEGGLGGGGGIFDDLLGLTGEGAGIATDLGTSVVDAVAPALGSLVGTFVGQKASDATGGGGGGDLQIQEPLAVTVENTPLDVEDGTDVSVSVETPDLNPTFDNDFSPTFNPEFSPTFNPEFSPETNILSELEEVNLGGDGNSLSEPVDVVVTNTPIDVTGIGGGSTPQTRRRRENPLATIGKRAAAGGVTGLIGGAATGSIAGGVGALPGAAIGAALGTISGAAVGAGEVALRRRAAAQGGGGAQAGVSASTGDVHVTINADVQSAVQQAVEQVRREQERQRQELRRELEGEISDLRRQIQSGGRSGLGGPI